MTGTGRPSHYLATYVWSRCTLQSKSLLHLELKPAFSLWSVSVSSMSVSGCRDMRPQCCSVTEAPVKQQDSALTETTQPGCQRHFSMFLTTLTVYFSPRKYDFRVAKHPPSWPPDSTHIDKRKSFFDRWKIEVYKGSEACQIHWLLAELGNF